LLPYVSDVGVVHDNFCSDHLPLFACFKSLVHLHASDDDPLCDDRRNLVCDWLKASLDDVNRYRSALGSILKLINIPTSAMCCTPGCSDTNHQRVLSDYYNDIISCINKVTEANIPMSNSRHCQYNIPGWSNYVSDKHDAARHAFRAWTSNGKPRSGWLYTNMYKTRALFKQALRYCRRHEEQMKADSLAKSLDNTDSNKFWKDVATVSRKKATSHVSKIGNCVGEHDICDMWKDHFKSLYNSVSDGGARSEFERNCSSAHDANYYNTVTVQDIIDAVSAQSKGKSAGPNGIFMESFIYACPELWIHFSLFFYCLY